MVRVEFTIFAMGHTPADTPSFVQPILRNIRIPKIRIDMESSAGRAKLIWIDDMDYAYNIVDLGSSRTPAEDPEDPTLIIFFVADMATYDQPAPPHTNHIQSMLARLAEVRAAYPVAPVVVMLRGMRSFRRGLDTVPLEKCFPGYDWLANPADSAQDLGKKLDIDFVIRRMEEILGSNRMMYVDLVEGPEGSERELSFLASAVKDILAA